MDQRWSIGNNNTSLVENNLTIQDVAKKIFEFQKSGSKDHDLMVWTQGWITWKCFLEVNEVVEIVDSLKPKMSPTPPPLHRLPTPPPLQDNSSQAKVKAETPAKEINHSSSHPIVENKPEPTYLNKEVKTIQGQSNTKNDMFKHKRKHPRVFARLRCIIRSETLTFRTFTHDISLGGVSLEDEIPQELIGTQCNLYISSPKISRNLKFKIALSERCVAKYFSFQNAPDDIISELSLWLKENEKMSKAS